MRWSRLSRLVAGERELRASREMTLTCRWEGSKDDQFFAVGGHWMFFPDANTGVCQSDSVEEGAEIVGAKESSNAPSSSRVDRRAKRAWQWL